MNKLTKMMTRKEYDKLVPMEGERLNAWLRADRQWSLGGVTVTFQTAADLVRVMYPNDKDYDPEKAVGVDCDGVEFR